MDAIHTVDNTLLGGISDSVVKIGCRVESIRPGKLTGQVAMVAKPRLLTVAPHTRRRGLDGLRVPFGGVAFGN